MPVPVRRVVAGERPPFVGVTVTPAVNEPKAVGLKLTVIVQPAPAAMVEAQLDAFSVKRLAFAPVSAMPLSSRLVLPEFDSVIVCAALVVPMV